MIIYVKCTLASFRSKASLAFVGVDRGFFKVLMALSFV